MASLHHNYELISSQFSLEKHCQAIAQEKFIALDSEFSASHETYYPQLSTIQIAYDDKVIVVDMLQDNDFSNLKEILENDAICKVIHSFQQDLQSIYSKLQCRINNIFDSQIAQSFLSHDRNMGYVRLVAKYLNISIDKQEQVSSWLKRPLSTKQLQYAAKDVFYLKQIYKPLLARLKEESKLDWFHDEMIASEQEQHGYLLAPDSALHRIAKGFGHKINNTATLKLLMAREKIAAQRNVPRHKVIGNSAILTLKKHYHINKQQGKNFALAQFHGRFAHDFCNMLNSDLQQKTHYDEALYKLQRMFENKSSVDCKKSKTFKKLHQIFNECAEQHKMCPRLLANSDDIIAICKHKSLGDKISSTWRQDALHLRVDELLSVIQSMTA